MQLLSSTTECDVAPTASDSAAALLDALPAVMWFVRRQMRSRRAAGLSVPQFRVLVHLDRCPARSLLSVAESLGSSLPTVSRIVSGLVARGLVARAADTHDRRRLALHLTDAGRAELVAAWSGTQQAVAERLAELSPADRATITRAFTLLGQVFACREHGPPGAACPSAARTAAPDLCVSSDSA